MARIPLEPIGTPLAEYLDEALAARNLAFMEPLEERLKSRRNEVRQAWGPQAIARVRSQQKLTAWERIELLRDPSSPVLTTGTFVNWGRRFEGSEREAPGAGVITAFIRVCDRWVLTVANDNLVAAGAWWPGTPEKIQRAQEVALRLRIPVVYLVESSGLFLPQQAGTFGPRHGAGGIFRMNALLSAAGVPQIAGVFGACVAGGAYMPIISDRVVMTEQAWMAIGGTPLLAGAKANALDAKDLGGPDVHVHQSGCADERVPDDQACIEVLRRLIARLPSSASNYYRDNIGPLPPAYDPSELSSLFPPDPRETYDIKQILARLLDGSLFHEVLPDRGREVLLGVGRFGGLWAGIIANYLEGFPHPEAPDLRRAGGVLYREGVARMSTFVRHCDEDGLPVIWFQDVAGFDIGREAESEGLLGFGSSLIYTNSTIQTPVLTVLLRRASGAGYYAQSGMPFLPLFQLATPISRLAVMDGRTAALARYAPFLDENFRISHPDPVRRASMERGMAEVIARLDADMDPYAAASRMDVDEIVTLPELRDWLVGAVEMCYQSTGYRRIRNPRIWSLHDLEVLCSPL